MKKRFVLLSLVLCTMIALTACNLSPLLRGFDVEGYVTGNIDSIYLNKHSKTYLEIVDTTEEIAKQDYLDGLNVAAEYFALYWGIVEPDYGERYDDLSDALKKKITDLLDEIYSHTKYTIGSSSKTDDGYTVEVFVSPINIMELAYDAAADYAPLQAFLNKYADTDFNAMSDADYWAYTHEYGNVIVQLVRDQLPNLGHKDTKSLVMRIEKEDGFYTINNEDWNLFDSYVIYFP